MLVISDFGKCSISFLAKDSVRKTKVYTWLSHTQHLWSSGGWGRHWPRPGISILCPNYRLKTRFLVCYMLCSVISPSSYGARLIKRIYIVSLNLCICWISSEWFSFLSASRTSLLGRGIFLQRILRLSYFLSWLVIPGLPLKWITCILGALVRVEPM